MPTQTNFSNQPMDQRMLANHINSLMSQDQITIYPQHPSNIISGTYINSNIIVHNPAVTVSKKQTKARLANPDLPVRSQNHSID
jgi:hypothetical protein